MINYHRILKECFWDLNFTKKDIEEIITQDDIRRKKFLFNKLLRNSKNLLVDLKIFNINDLREIVDGFKVPSFNSAYISRRKNIVEVYFFNKALEINELKWR